MKYGDFLWRRRLWALPERRTELRGAIYLTDDATEIQIALFYLWNQSRPL